MVFCLTRSGLEPTIYRTRGGNANHYTTDVVKKRKKTHRVTHTRIYNYCRCMSFNMCILNHNLLGLSDLYQLNLHYAVQRSVHHSEVPDLGDIKTGTICIPILEKHKCRTQYLVFFTTNSLEVQFRRCCPYLHCND